MKNPELKFLFTALFIVLLHSVFFIYALRQNNFYLLPDSSEYLNQRDNLLKYGSFYQGKADEPHRWYLETRRPPLTGIILAAIKKICPSDAAILVFQNLLSGCVLMAVLLFIKKHFPGFNFFLLLPFLLLFPAQMIYTNFIMAEIFFQSLLFVSLWFLLKKDKNFIWFFVFLTLAAFIKPVLYLFWIPAAVLLLLFRKRLQVPWFQFSGVIIMAAAVMLFSWFNFNRNGVFAFSSASESFLPDYVALPVLHYAGGKEAALRVHGAIHQSAQQESRYAGYHNSLIQQSLHVVKEYPFTTAALWAKGMVLFFTDPGRWDVLAFQNKKTEEHQDGFFHILKSQGVGPAVNHLISRGAGFTLFTVAGTAVHALLFFFFLIFLKDASYPLPFRLMAAALVFYLAFMTGIIGSARYRVAVFPVMLMAVPSGWIFLKEIIEKFMRSRKAG